MSYILEALKKVERKREQEAPLRRLTFLEKTGSGPKERPIGLYLLIIALLLNAGLMVWWITPWRAKEKAPSTRPYAVQPTNLPPPILAGKNRPNPAAEAKEDLPKKNSPAAAALTTGKETQNLPSTPAPRKEARNLPQPVAGKSPATIQPSVEPQPRIKKAPTLSEKVYDLDELPSGLKNALPEIKVSAHVYNQDRQNRMVRVNERILQEGQELSPGLKVEEIISGGIIFSYQGYRFHFGL